MLGLHETVCTGAADGYARMTQVGSPLSFHLFHTTGPASSAGRHATLPPMTCCTSLYKLCA